MPGREDSGQNSWTEYRNLVMQSLENLNESMKSSRDELSEEVKGSREDLTKEIKDYRKDIDLKFDRATKRFNDFEIQMTVDITTLKTKAAVWGGVFGAIVGAVVSTVIDILIQSKLSH